MLCDLQMRLQFLALKIVPHLSTVSEESSSIIYDLLKLLQFLSSGKATIRTLIFQCRTPPNPLYIVVLCYKLSSSSVETVTMLTLLVVYLLLVLLLLNLLVYRLFVIKRCSIVAIITVGSSQPLSHSKILKGISIAVTANDQLSKFRDMVISHGSIFDRLIMLQE